MKLSLLTDGITPYVTGGMQKHSYCLARYFAERGISLDLYHDYGHLLPREAVEQLDAFEPEARKRITGIPFHFPPPGKVPGHYLRRSKAFSEQIREEFVSRPMPDFVIAKGFTPWALLDARPKGLPPLGVKFHGMNMFQTPTGVRGRLESALFRPIVRSIMRKADYVFSYGGKITEIIADQGIAPERILEFPSGIEREWLDGAIEEHEEVRFLYVGRYERLKGIEELYTAIQRLPADAPFRMNFAGPIPEDKRLTHPKVHYYGQITDRMALREIYKSHDVLVSPSYSEGMPNAILEAMALGLSTLSTDTGAVNALVNENTGWLLQAPPDPKAIETALKTIMHERELLTTKRNAAYAHIRDHFVWNVIIDALTARMKTLV